ncbi:hypothetical protein JCM10207_003300, partial [Rhodosporidiobolus poonsookiae]
LSASPSKLLAPTSSFAARLLGMETAARETAQQRAKGWSLNSLPMGKPVWVHVRKEGEEGGFWWPGEVDGPLWVKPLRVKLYVDGSSSVLDFSPEIVSFPVPSADDLVTFRNPTRLRFDKTTFRDSDTTPAPSADALASVLERAIAKDAEGDGDDSDSDGGLLPPSSFGQAGANGKKGKGKKKAAPSSSDVDQLVATEEEAESEDELLADHEAVGIDFPSLCIARKKGWWAATVLSYDPPASPKKGSKAAAKRPKGKFTVEWSTQEQSKVTRADILFPRDKGFTTVPLGKTYLDLGTNYTSYLTTFVTETLPPTYQAIISEAHPPTQTLSDAFYAGGKKRAELRKSAVYGEYEDSVIDIVREAVVAWVKSGGENGARPIGSARYEELGDAQRLEYAADVLLPTAVVLNVADDGKLEDDAREELKQRNNGAEPTEKEVEALAFRMAKEQLQCRSVTKAVLMIRQSQGIIRNARAQEEEEQ